MTYTEVAKEWISSQTKEIIGQSCVLATEKIKEEKIKDPGIMTNALEDLLRTTIHMPIIGACSHNEIVNDAKALNSMLTGDPENGPFVTDKAPTNSQYHTRTLVQVQYGDQYSIEIASEKEDILERTEFGNSGIASEMYSKLKKSYIRMSKGVNEDVLRHVYICGPFPIYGALLKCDGMNGLNPIFILYPELNNLSLVSGDFYRVAADCLLVYADTETGGLSLKKTPRLFRHYALATGGSVAPVVAAFQMDKMPSLSQVRTDIQRIFERPEHLCNDQRTRMEYGKSLHQYSCVYSIQSKYSGKVNDNSQLQLQCEFLCEVYGKVIIRDYMFAIETLNALTLEFSKKDPVTIDTIIGDLEKASNTYRESPLRALENLMNMQNTKQTIDWTRDDRYVHLLYWAQICESILHYSAMDIRFKMIESSKWNSSSRREILRALKAYLYESLHATGLKNESEMTKVFRNEIEKIDQVILKTGGIIQVSDVIRELAQSFSMVDVYDSWQSIGSLKIRLPTSQSLQQIASIWKVYSQDQNIKKFYSLCKGTLEKTVIPMYEIKCEVSEQSLRPKKDERFNVIVQEHSDVNNKIYDDTMWNVPLYVPYQNVREDSTQIQKHTQKFVRESHTLRDAHNIAITPNHWRRDEIIYSMHDECEKLIKNYVHILRDESFQETFPPICIHACGDDLKSFDLLLTRKKTLVFLVMYHTDIEKYQKMLSKSENVYFIVLHCTSLKTRDRLIVVDKLFMHLGFPAMCYLNGIVSQLNEVGSLVTRQGTLERFSHYTWSHYLQLRSFPLCMLKDNITQSSGKVLTQNEQSSWFIDQMEKFEPSLSNIQKIYEGVAEKSSNNTDFSRLITDQEPYKRLYVMQATSNLYQTMPTNRQSCVIFEKQLPWNAYLKIYCGDPLYQSAVYNFEEKSSILDGNNDTHENIRIAENDLMKEMQNSLGQTANVGEWAYVMPFYEARVFN